MTAWPSAVRIIQDRPLVNADVRRRQIARSNPSMTLPLKIQARRIARLDHIHFLARPVAHVADENSPGGRVDRHAMRAAQAEADKIPPAHWLADERIIVRNVIIRRRAQWLAAARSDG